MSHGHPLRSCSEITYTEIPRIAGYVRDFPRVLSGEKTSRMYKLFLNSSLAPAGAERRPLTAHDEGRGAS